MNYAFLQKLFATDVVQIFKSLYFSFLLIENLIDKPSFEIYSFQAC